MLKPILNARIKLLHARGLPGVLGNLIEEVGVALSRDML
jgi:hypothetical protein